MVTLDSDLMGILMALLTFLIPLISALAERKRKKRKGTVADILPDEEPVLEQQDPMQERLDDLEEMFNMILGKQSQEEIECQMEPVEVVKIAEEATDVAVEEEGESATVNKENQVVDKSNITPEEEPRKGLKERIKDNPKDMVLFSEILNPKFKEY